MTSTSTYRQHLGSLHLDICIGAVGYQIEPHNILTYFEQFGAISRYNFTSPTGGGFVFITYETPESVDRCMASRPHRLEGRYLRVKRALPFNAEHSRDHLESSRDIMILSDSLQVNDDFLQQLREYFSTYGTVYACKYCHETNFNFFLVEFADFDQVDRVILDKPHYFDKQELNMMKCLPANRLHMNIKYSPTDKHAVVKDAIDVDDDQKFLQYELNFKETRAAKKNDYISGVDLQNEVHRLQAVMKCMNEEFNSQRKQLEEDCCKQLKKLNEDAGKTHRLQQDLEQEYAKLLAEYESLKLENEALNEQYLTAELENFEITSYYEQILAQEKAKTARSEAEYTHRLQCLYAEDASLQSSPRGSRSGSRTSSSPLPPAIPDDD